ncbi:hypothetical protein BDW71DRAFT_209621 [Aspergillus fruticulosus]
MFETPLCRACGEPATGLAGISRSWYEVCPGCEAINNGLEMCDVCMEGEEEVEGVCWRCNDEEWIRCSYGCENGLCVSDTMAISCGAQGSSKGVRCVATNQPCPGGLRPVFYDDPAPCYNNQRCCA